MAVYGAIGFGILEGVDLLAAALRLPAALVTIVALAVVAGFPLALVLSWNYRLSAAGVARTADPAPGEIEAIVAAPAWPLSSASPYSASGPGSRSSVIRSRPTPRWPSSRSRT